MMLTDDEKKAIEAEAHHFEQKSGAGIEALKIVQRGRGWVDDETLRAVAGLLDMTAEDLDGVATFYNLIHRRPVGRHVIRVCSSVSCWIMGYEDLLEHLRRQLGIQPGETTADGRFTLVTNQCLGACDHAPVFMIDDDLYLDLDAAKLDAALTKYE
ncbi:MAG: NADH-quinone oxidoreductase subunit [Candidatus Hydrogenedentes bacterium]|nr:NADH-quinone oxidoreductase subunit [Candidatus Hydrogenedentota bacterium]